MDVNPYESPLEIDELPPETQPRPTCPIWQEILYLALTALAVIVLVPAVIVLAIVALTRFFI